MTLPLITKPGPSVSVFDPAAKLMAVPAVPVTVPELKTSELPPKLIAVAPDIVPELVTVPPPALTPELLPDNVPEFDMSAMLLASTPNAPPEMFPELVMARSVASMPWPPAADKIVPELITVAVVAKIPDVDPEMEPELLTFAILALMPKMLPEMVPKLLVTFEVLALMPIAP